MTKWFHVVSKALTFDQCQELVTYAQTHSSQEATVGHGGGKSVNTNIRKSTIRWLKRSDPVLKNLYEVILAETHKANADFFGKDIRSFNDVQFTEYPVGEFYNWHQDCAPVSTDSKPFDRKLSVCIQLSDRNSYEGGEFWVNPSHKKLCKEFWDIGDMVIFPSELWHKVSPVTEGTRFSLVTWFLGPRN